MSHRQPFLNIRTEGALLPSDLLSRMMEGTNLAGLKPEDYHLGAGEMLNEAISRSWTRLLSLWAGFRKAKGALPPSDLGTTLTRERWLLQLFQELGYGRLIGTTPFEIDGKTYPITHVWQGQYYQVPIHLVSFRADLDKRSEQRIQGATKASPHGMVQEFLNRSEHDVWAFVSNGLKLLILRDNASLTRQAYVEFDLEGIFEGEVYSDFRLLWLLSHQSRLEGTAKDRPKTCWLEVWSKQAQTDGRRALDQLRVGVEKALENLGTGFISHKANQALRGRLQAGELQKQDYYRQLLRLVYRLIFLFVAEDRDLLHSPGASDEARSRYARFYSGQRLRRMAERTRGGRHADLWVAMRLVFAKLGNDYGCPELGLSALGGFLFGPEAMPDLESAELANEYLLLAIRNLALVKDRSGWRLVDYRNLGSEELGSVYESLLELNPTMELPAGIFTLDTVAGNQRKTSGSYYTPDSLVQCLLDSALDPVVEQAIKGKTAADSEKAILALKVCDPAVGSGHFLVGAAHRLAKHLANVRAQAQGESEPSPLYYQRALRDVIGHCLYGVDVNPMAAELCRVSLWLEAIEPGKPLSFLDHHIRVGNSLLGATPALLAKGIPDEAFTLIEGDDKEICSRFKKLNKTEKIGYRRLFAATTEPWERLGDLAASMSFLDNAPDDSIEAVHNKERMYEAMVRSGNYLDGQFWADTWCAAFVWKKTQEFNHPITEEDFRRIEHNPYACDPWMRDEIVRLSQQYQFFHWHLAFPDVFRVPAGGETAENEQMGWDGGFDVVLGNPPWEMPETDDRIFFALHQTDIAVESSAQTRQKLISRLSESNPSLWRLWQEHLRRNESERVFIADSGLFPYAGGGRLNYYRLFIEVNWNLLRPLRPLGMVVQSGLSTNKYEEPMWLHLLGTGAIGAFLDFENAENLFPGVDRRTKFSLLTATRGMTGPMKIGCWLRSVDELNDSERTVFVTIDELREFDPESLSLPQFRSQRDLLLLRFAYQRHGRFADNTEWAHTPKLMFSSSDKDFRVVRNSDASSWLSRRDGKKVDPNGISYVPVYEGKMVGIYDHRQADIVINPANPSRQAQEVPLKSIEKCDAERLTVPQYWIQEEVVREKRLYHEHDDWTLAFCDVTSATNERTCIASVLPLCGLTRSMPAVYLKSTRAKDAIVLQSILSSLPLDYYARLKVAANHLTQGILESLPLPGPAEVEEFANRIGVPTIVERNAIELIYTAWEFWNHLRGALVMMGHRSNGTTNDVLRLSRN